MLTDAHYIRRVVMTLAVIALAYGAWQLAGVWLLIFGAVLIAVILRAIAAPIERHAGISSDVALFVAVALITLTLVVTLWLAGNSVEGQIGVLAEKIPAAWRDVQRYFRGSMLSDWSKDMGDGTGMLSSLSWATTTVIGTVADIGLMLFGGIYLAARPDFYRKGLLKMLPASATLHVAETMDASGHALKLWLKGQLISMTIVAVLVGLGLWLVGLPSALTLGLLAGLGEFIPIIGTLFAAIPALILAFAVDTETALWTLGVYVFVQQVQGNIIMPIIQQHMVYLPPAITLFALMIFAMLFGPLGVLFAAPLTVVVYVAVKKLYVQDTLGEETPIPGEDEAA